MRVMDIIIISCITTLTFRFIIDYFKPIKQTGGCQSKPDTLAKLAEETKPPKPQGS